MFGRSRNANANKENLNVRLGNKTEKWGQYMDRHRVKGPIIYYAVGGSAVLGAVIGGGIIGLAAAPEARDWVAATAESADDFLENVGAGASGVWDAMWDTVVRGNGREADPTQSPTPTFTPTPEATSTATATATAFPTPEATATATAFPTEAPSSPSSQTTTGELSGIEVRE